MKKMHRAATPRKVYGTEDFHDLESRCGKNALENPNDNGQWFVQVTEDDSLVTCTNCQKLNDRLS